MEAEPNNNGTITLMQYRIQDKKAMSGTPLTIPSAMSAETLSRLLARFSPSTLRCGCNDALRGELKDVDERLEEAKAAVSQLKEVEEAVDRLQQEKNDRHRSKSLLRLLREVQGVEKELQRGVKRLERGFSGPEERDERPEMKVESKKAKVEEEAQVAVSTQPRAADAVQDRPTDDDLLTQAQDCLDVVTSGEEPSFGWLKKVFVRLETLLRAIERHGGGSAAHDQAVGITVEALRVYADHMESAKLGYGALGPLSGLISAAREVSSRQFQMEAARVLASLDARFHEAKHNTLGRPDLQPLLGLVLEIDELPEQKKYARLDEVTTALLQPGLLNCSAPARAQLVAAVRVAFRWVEGYTSTLASDTVAEAILKFKDTSLAVIGRYLSAAERDRLLKSIHEAKRMPAAENGETPPEFPNEHPAALAAKKLRGLPGEERNKNLGEFTAALEFDFTGAPMYLVSRYEGQLGTAITDVVARILKHPIDELYVDEYTKLCSNVQALARELPNQESLYLRLVDPLIVSLEWIKSGGRTAGTSESVGDSSSGDFVDRTLDQIEEMKLKKNTAVGEFDQVVKLLTWVFKVCKCEQNWNPRSDQRMHDLVAKLRECAKTIRKPDLRKSREELAQGWLTMLSRNTHRRGSKQ